MHQNLFILAFFSFLYGLVSKKMDASYLSGPIIFVLFGLLVGPYGLGFLDIEIDAELISSLAEFTLALVLFTDASMMKAKFVRKNIKTPRRLLFIGLPLTIGFGFVFAIVLFTEFLWIEALILAVILAPTDAALGKPVVNNTGVPNKIRQSLNVESGLNDGICVPILLVCFAMSTQTTDGSEILWHVYFVKTIGIGILVGTGLTFLGTYLMRQAIKWGFASETWNRMIAITLSLSIFLLAEVLGGSGFIACFSGGAIFGVLVRQNKLRYEIAAEGVGDIMSLATWVVFGAVVVGRFFVEVNLMMIIYAVLSLTIIRMVPVSFSLSGLKVKRKERLFIGWFGPRGLASIVFVVMALQQNLPHIKTISMIAVGTILLSIVAHGLSANPLINKYFKS